MKYYLKTGDMRFRKALRISYASVNWKTGEQNNTVSHYIQCHATLPITKQQFLESQ